MRSQLNITVNNEQDEELFDRAAKHAEKEYRSLSKLIKKILKEYLDKQDGKE